MSALAQWLSRRLWYAMLWLMRRPWMKGLQRSALRLVPSHRRDRAWEGIVRQNKFARRFGLPLMTFLMNLLLASVMITLIYSVTLDLAVAGAFTVPAR